MKKTLNLGKIEAKEKKAAKDEMVRKHHQCNGHEPEPAEGFNMQSDTIRVS